MGGSSILLWPIREGMGGYQNVSSFIIDAQGTLHTGIGFLLPLAVGMLNRARRTIYISAAARYDIIRRENTNFQDGCEGEGRFGSVSYTYFHIFIFSDKSRTGFVDAVYSCGRQLPGGLSLVLAFVKRLQYIDYLAATAVIFQRRSLHIM